MRVYVPMTLPGLARAVQAGEIGPAPLDGYAVTPGLREWYSDGDAEELEYAAMVQAARASLRLLGRAESAVPRRVVVAVEVQADLVSEEHELGRAVVEVSATVPMARVASAHVDDDAATDDIRAAVDALPASDEGDGDARFTVESAEGHELMWYAAQELKDLVT